jgi:transposase
LDFSHTSNHEKINYLHDFKFSKASWEEFNRPFLYVLANSDKASRSLDSWTVDAWSVMSDEACNGLIKQDTSKDRFIMSTEVIMSNKNKQIRPSFTLEFKQSAAKLVNEKGYSQRQAADSLGVSLSALSRWVRAERSSSNSTPTQKKVFNLLEQDELTRLRKEVAQLRMEREILKKAAVFFAKELQ